MHLPSLLDLAAIQNLYASGSCSPHDLIDAVASRIDSADPAIFISKTPRRALTARVDALLTRAPEPNSLPLWGIPFAVKDNIDVAGLPTTCACPEFAHVPAESARVVEKLEMAGAIIIGKTNLDQFATGLNGTRSPYGAPRSVFDPAHISGGSSSGSAVAVASGLASFALGTDTAGSGRVPAMLNNIVGIKPTPGLLSTRGLVPACESLDCISVFALSVADGAIVRRLAEGYDAADPWSRRTRPLSLPEQGLRIGVLKPGDREFVGRDQNATLYAKAIEHLGGDIAEIEYAPFREVAALLYEGAWVAERQAAFESFGVPAAALDPAIATIYAGAANFSAVDAFRDFHKLAALKRRCEEEMAKVDLLLLPTAPRSYKVEEMLAEPIRHNAALGLYTNFCNLLGLSAIAVPAGFADDGLPFGVTLVGGPFADEALGPIADRLHKAAACGTSTHRKAVLPDYPAFPPPADSIELAVVGAHLSGMALNDELQALDAQLVGRARTSPDYRLFVLPDTEPAKPGLVFSPGSGGDGIELEVWSLTPAAFGQFVAKIGSPLGIGKIRLSDGSKVSGFLCEAWAIECAEEITHHGGWRAFRSEVPSTSMAQI